MKSIQNNKYKAKIIKYQNKIQNLINQYARGECNINKEKCGGEYLYWNGEYCCKVECKECFAIKEKFLKGDISDNMFDILIDVLNKIINYDKINKEILSLGSADGLNENKIKNKIKDINIYSTDLMPRGEYVKKLSYDEAIIKYKVNILLAI